MKPTLEDAIGAVTMLSASYPQLEGSPSLATISAFLAFLLSKVEPSQIASDRQGYIIEGAYQKGFEPIDDDADLMVVSDRKLIEFVEHRQKTLCDLAISAALEDAANACEKLIEQHDIHSNFMCAREIRTMDKQAIANRVLK